MHSLIGAMERLRADLSADSAPGRWPRGVIGAYGADDDIHYGYPESAGYWLRWASDQEDVSDARGYAVIDWLDSCGSIRAGWPTRVFRHSDGLDPSYTDARYLFDHVMLWDGLRCWGHLRGDRAARHLAGTVWTHLQRHYTASTAPWLIVGRGALPPRWCGQIGPFLLKVCSRIQTCEGPLVDACTAVAPLLMQLASSAPHRQAHPQLYAIEGMLGLGFRSAASDVLTSLIETHGGLIGLRETPDAGPRRWDVVAQALRAFYLTDLYARYAPDLERTAYALAARIDRRGRLPFTDSSTPHYPTWAALFAEQALRCITGPPLDPTRLV